jgi:hypothetical protein
VTVKPIGTGYKRHDLKYSKKGYDQNKLQQANKDPKLAKKGTKSKYESLPTVTEQEPASSVGENVTIVYGTS